MYNECKILIDKLIQFLQVRLQVITATQKFH